MKNNNINIRIFHKRSNLFGVFAVWLFYLGLSAYAIFQSPEGKRITFVGLYDVLVPVIIMLTLQALAILLVFLALLQLWGNFNDLLKRTPLLEFTPKTLKIRRLLSVHKVDWQNIFSIKFVQYGHGKKRPIILRIDYKIHKNENVFTMKNFRCSLRRLTIDKEELIKLFNNVAPEHIKKMATEVNV